MLEPRPGHRQRNYTTTSQNSIAAPPIDFGLPEGQSLPPPNSHFARIVPASPSYFTGKPDFTDDLLSLQAILRKYQTLPTVTPGQATRVAWQTLAQYKLQAGEPVKTAKYHRILDVLKRLNLIHPALRPTEVADALDKYKRDINPYANVPIPGIIDDDGKTWAIGRRKASSAKVYLVEGNGQVLVNGKSLSQAFGRIHDRESAIWALKSTGRMDKYNVWALVSGGGSTGQAEAITLGAARALLVHEPMLKPALRRGGYSVSFHLGDPIISLCLQESC